MNERMSMTVGEHGVTPTAAHHVRNSRRARYYTLTAAGKKQLAAEREEFDRVVAAIRMVLDFA